MFLFCVLIVLMAPMFCQYQNISSFKNGNGIKMTKYKNFTENLQHAMCTLTKWKQSSFFSIFGDIYVNLYNITIQGSFKLENRQNNCMLCVKERTSVNRCSNLSNNFENISLTHGCVLGWDNGYTCLIISFASDICLSFCQWSAQSQK